MKRCGLVVTLVLGCSSHQAAAPKTTATAAPVSQCAQVAEHLVSEMAGAQQASPEEVDPYRNLLEKRCNEDKWSADLQKCLLASKTLQENKPCESMFTEEQNANLERDGKAAENAATKPAQDEKKEERSRGPMPKGSRKTGDPDEGGQ